MCCICVTIMIQCEYNVTEGGINMSKTKTIHVRIDSDLKKNAGYLLNSLGISTSEAIKIFLSQVVLNRGLPFEVKVPKYNEETELAMKEARKISKTGKGFKDIDLLFKELDN